MTKLHVVEKRLKSGSRWYVYAWRGGPCIHTQDGPRPIITQPILDAQREARDTRFTAGMDDIDSLIRDYEASPEYTKREASTKRDYRLWLTRISQRFGSTPLEVFEDRLMRGEIIDWRDQWADKPRTADKATVMMGTLLSWALERGRVSINVAAGIKQLHKVDKSDEIWEASHWQAWEDLEEAPPAHLMDALKLDSLTGLRLGDLVKLDIANVGEQAIILITNKRKGRAVIPILPELRALLTRLIGDRKAGPVLLNSRKKPWTESGLGSVFQKSKPAGFDRRIHDLRGTYVTWLAIKGLTDDEIARIVGWTAKRVAAVRARYVNEARVVVSLVERLSA